MERIVLADAALTQGFPTVLINTGTFSPTVGSVTPPVPQLIGDAGNIALNGTEMLDVMVGNAGNDSILSLGGNVLVQVGLGNDCIDAGQGAVHVMGGEGYDRALGNGGRDRL